MKSRRVLTSVPFLVPAAFWLAGCGGGHSGAGGGVTVEQRLSLLDAIHAKHKSLSGKDLQTTTQEMVAFFRSMKEFTVVKVTEGGDVVATFTDGMPFIIFNDFPGDSKAAKSVARYPQRTSRAATPELPGERSAVLLDSLGHGTDLFHSNPIDDICSQMSSHGYDVGFVRNATLDSLSGLGGDGVFYISAHGSAFTDQGGEPHFQMLTSTTVPEKKTGEKESEWIARVRELRDILTTWDPSTLGFGEAEGGQMSIGINERFVEKYWHDFGRNSLVYISTCHSLANNAMRDACFRKNASVYAGWTFRETPDANFAASEFVFDRLLGANELGPRENPLQRPFDYAAVYEDMKLRDLDWSLALFSVKRSFFQFKANPNPDTFGLLAPSIRKMTMDEENSQLILDGIFGNDPGTTDGKVFVGGKEMTSRTWDPKLKQIIIHDLPLTGQGSAGDVYVLVRGHKSNVRQLTDWRGTVTWRDEATYPTGFSGKPFEEFKLKIHVRADVGKFRDKPGEDPKWEAIPIQIFAAKDSTAEYSAGGSATITQGGQTIGESWSRVGPATVPLLFRRDASDERGWGFNGTLDFQQKTLSVYIGGGIKKGLQISKIAGGVTTPYQAEDTGFSPDLFLQKGKLFTLQLNDDFSIQGDTLSASQKDVMVTLNYTLSWDSVSPQFPPDPMAARSVVIGRVKAR